MSHVFALYRNLLQPWMCVCVYLWALELQAAITFDREPLLDVSADAALILLTAVFWALVLCVLLLGLNVFIRHATLVRLNTAGCKALLIGVTAYYFVRWLNIAALAHVDADVIMLSLGTIALVLAIRVIRRRRIKPALDSEGLPSLADCCHFGAVPVLLVAVALVVVKVAGNLSFEGLVSFSGVKSSDTAIPGRMARPNIIMIVSDALRAQSMSLYGHARKTTPFLERLAESSNVYLNMHASSTSTKPSITTILSGKHPLSHGRLTKAQPPYQSDENLLEVLKQNGYVTASIVSNEDASLNLLGFGKSLSLPEYSEFEWLTLSWFRRLGIHPTSTGGRMYIELSRFIPYLGFPRKTSFYGFADETLAQARKILSRLREPYFLFIHLQEPHDPYEAGEFRGIYSSRGAAKWRTKLPSGHYSRYAPELQPAADAYRDQYEESIRFLDSEVERFIDYVDRSGREKNLLLILAADHGESFERGFMNHGEDLYESSTHVPLLIKFPGQTKGRRMRGLVDGTNLAPTILNAVKIGIPVWMDGRPLAPDDEPERDSAISINYKDPVGQTKYPLPTKLAIWREDYKMIVLCDTDKVELYNLLQDPGETVDLSSEKAPLVRELKHRLRSSINEQPAGKLISCLKQGF